jgi:hypothetical protein
MLTVSTAEGQEVARSFEQLHSRVTVGNQVAVTDVGGRVERGRITALSLSSLTLLVGTTEREFFEADIETISRRDSRWSGTLWGLGAGGALGAWLDRGLVREYGREDIGVGESVEFVATAAGVGAGIGFLVDALIKGQRVVYSKPRASTRNNTMVVPMWGTGRQGLSVSLKF